MKKLGIPIVLLLSLLISNCAIFQTFANLSRLKFRLGNVENLYVEGISVSGKSRLSDFSAFDIAAVGSSISRGSLKVSLVLNVEAVNPNDGKGGFPSTSASINSFPYRLNIDGNDVITGNIGSPFIIPGTGEKVTIPLSVSTDLLKNVQDKGYQSLLNLVLKVAGIRAGTNSSSAALYAKPVIGTAIGNISYPQEIKIISEQFNQ